MKGLDTRLQFIAPQELTDNESEILIQKLKQTSDDEKIKKELIKRLVEGHIKLTVKIVGRYASFVKNKDELINEAFFGLVYGVNKAITHLQDNKITPYLMQCVRFFCYNYIKREKIRKTQIYPEKIYSGENYDDIKKKKNYFFNDPLADHSEYLFRNLRETLDASIRDPIERAIIDLRMQGYNDPEIAEMMHVTKARIGQIRKLVRERFNKLMEK